MEYRSTRFQICGVDVREGVREFVSWRPWHREHQMQGNAKLLGTVNMSVRGGVGDDGIGEKGLLR
jgi:hypothetical protein